MTRSFLIVSEDILPDYLTKVIEARRLLEANEVTTVTDAVKRVGISRNTYYKYKDSVFAPEEALQTRKASFSLILGHVPGVLYAVLHEVSRFNASVITISQSTPVALRASVMMVLDITNMKGSIDELLDILKSIPEVHKAQLDAIE